MKKIWRHIKNYVSGNFLAEQSQWISIFPFLFALGISLYFALPFEPNIWLSVAIFEGCLFLIYHYRMRGEYILFMAVLIIVCGFINIQAHSLYQSKHIENINDRTVTYLKGQIADINRSEKGKVRILLAHAENYDTTLKGNYRITLSSKTSDLKIGQCVETVATLFARSPMPILNGYQIDRKNFYENLSAIGYTDSEIFVVDCPREYSGYNFKQRLNSLRKNITDYIAKVLPAKEAGIADALLVGEKSFIAQNTIDNYRNSGLAHFLSVSGLHLGTIDNRRHTVALFTNRCQENGSFLRNYFQLFIPTYFRYGHTCTTCFYYDFGSFIRSYLQPTSHIAENGMFCCNGNIDYLAASTNIYKLPNVFCCRIRFGGIL